MANNFISIQEMARAALPILQDNLVFPKLTYNDFSKDFAKKGDTIQIKKPPIYVANEFNDNIVKQDITEDGVLITLDKIADVSVGLTAKEMALNLEDFTAQVLNPAMVAIAQKINSDGLKLYKDISNVTGTAGTTPSDLSAFAAAAKTLNNCKAPMSDRYAVWDANALAAFQVLPSVINAEKSGTTKALREGSIGRILGFDNFMSQSVINHTAGVLTGSAKVKTAASMGDTTLEINATSLTGELKTGDIIKIGDNSYSVLVGGGAVSNAVTVTLATPLVSDLAVSTPITVVGNHTANLAFNKNAFAFVSRPLEVARGVESYTTNYNGISMRVSLGYDMATKTQTLSVDTLYGFKTIYPELACRVLG